jgi:hypothetical protein
MKKGLISIGVLVGFLLSFLMVTGVFAKDVVTHDVPYGKVTFTHKKHVDNYKVDCLKCHHTWKKGETTGKLCKECHKGAAEGKKPTVKDAFHKNCKGCHDDLKKANKPTGPAGCTQCHVKAKK